MSYSVLFRRATAVFTAALALGLSGCKQEVRFTKAPPEGSLAVREPREPTVVHFPLPLDLQPFREELARIVPDELVATTNWSSAALCRVAAVRRDCGGARIDINIARSGEIGLTTLDGRLAIDVPVAYRVMARGLAGQREKRDERTGTSRVRLMLQAGLKPGFVADIEPSIDVRMTDPVVEVLDLSVQLLPLLKARMDAIAPQIARALSGRLEQPSIQILVTHAWKALRAPVTIEGSVASWLVAEPASATSMGFVSEGGQIFLRIGIATRFRHVADETAAIPGPARPPVIEPATAAMDSTNVVIASWLPFEPLRSAIMAAAPRQRRLDSVVEGRGESVRSTLRDVHLYPSYGQLCIELSLDLIEPDRLAGRIGTLHLLAVPVVRAGSATLALDSIELAERHKPDKTYGVAVASEIPHPPASLEPYATLVGQAARVDVAREIQSALPRINSLVDRPLGQDMTLSANFGHAVVDSIVPENADLKISYELTGTLTLRIDPAVATAIQRTNDNRGW